MSQIELYLLPQPKRISRIDGYFYIDRDTWLVLPDTSSAACVLSAKSLQQEIAEATGLTLPLVKTAQPARQSNVMVLADAAEQLGDYADPPSLPADATQPDQSSALNITPNIVLALGAGAQGLHYAIQTLRQIVRTQGGALPCLTLQDWPALAKRGLMLDVSRGKVPTLDTLKLIVDQFSLFKLNVLQLYTEHTFVFPHHPRIGIDCGSLSGDDMLALDAYARERLVELMPNLQSFGHMGHILALPEYHHLAELDGLGWSVCPGQQEAYDLLSDMYGDLLPNFCSRTLNINCDETWDLGAGRSKKAVAERGHGRVYLDHILRLRELAAAQGCTIQLWGDILLHHPELVPELPEDVTLLDWHYDAAADYPSVRTFAASGRRFWVCPGTSSWNTLFPRIENSNGNIRTLVRLGTEYGAEGMLNTDWGDHGHYQPLGQCWYGYCYGAEQAWSGAQTPDTTFDRNLGPLLFGVGGEEVVQAMRDLARLLVLPGMPLRNATNSIFALLDEPLVGPLIETLPADTLTQVIEGCVKAEVKLYGALRTTRAALSVEEMIFSARLMAFAMRKVQLSQRIRADLAALPDDSAQTALKLAACLDLLRDVEVELLSCREEFEMLWLRRARRSEIGITLDYLDNLRQRYVAAQAWMTERLAQAQQGETPNCDLADYAHQAAGYEILGQTFRRRMRETGVRT